MWKLGCINKVMLRLILGKKKTAQIQQSFNMFKDKELMIFYPYHLNPNEFLSQTWFIGK